MEPEGKKSRILLKIIKTLPKIITTPTTQPQPTPCASGPSQALPPGGRPGILPQNWRFRPATRATQCQLNKEAFVTNGGDSLLITLLLALGGHAPLTIFYKTRRTGCAQAVGGKDSATSCVLSAQELTHCQAGDWLLIPGTIGKLGWMGSSPSTPPLHTTLCQPHLHLKPTTSSISPTNPTSSSPSLHLESSPASPSQRQSPGATALLLCLANC